MTLRDRAVEAAQQALAAAIAERTAAEAALAQDQGTTPESESARTVRGLHAASDHRAHLSRVRADRKRALDFARDVESDRRRALASAVRDREALAALHDRARDAHRATGQRAEAARLDDLALAGHFARS